MNLLKGIKKKWEANRQQKETENTLKVFGLETLLEQLSNAMDPENYNIIKEKKLYKIVEKYSILDDEGNAIPGDFEWKQRFSFDFDAEESGYFTTQDKAIEALETIIEKAANDFDDVLVEFKSLNKDYEEVID